VVVAVVAARVNLVVLEAAVAVVLGTHHQQGLAAPTLVVEVAVVSTLAELLEMVALALLFCATQATMQT
jgi:uncharacterized membrane protein YgdD (TMEM256/DUF423 family)